MSSIGSNASTIVSFRGEEIELDEALDALYREIQTNLNRSQCAVRSLACCEERNDTFLEAVGIYFEIDDHVESLFDLFRELQTVSKQCLGKPPKDLKDEYKKLCDDRKASKKQQKDEAKELQKLQKQVKLMEIHE
jgi:hypothetical protein